MKLRHWFRALALLLAASCRSPATGVPVPGGESCRVQAGGTAHRDTITIAFSERENEAGRLMLRLSGETLIRVDCEGRVHSRLARSWTRDSSGTAWTFDLDTQVNAASLVQQWDLRRNGGLWPWVRILEARATAAHRLEVRLDTIFAEIPPAFALPELTVSPGRLSDSGPFARILVHPALVDQRDLMDRSGSSGPPVDLVITRDPDAISYARSNPKFSVVPLAWDRTYVAVVPVARPGWGPGSQAELQESLASEVVRAGSRAAQAPFWWEETSCPGTMPLLPMGRLPQVVYQSGDQTAREIAERLVALERSRLQATGLSLDAFTASLAGGEAAAYVLSLSRTAPGGCSSRPAWPSASAVVPLVDVQAHALVRAGVPAFSLEADGTIRFDRPLLPVSLPGPMR